MRNLERRMVETGRVIQRRYLLQRLIKQGQACAVYQGFDQLLQRAVAVKIVPAEHASAYRAAIRATSQFAHPNIVGIYDLIIEAEILYVVQEYVDGDNFEALLQMQLTPYQVADFGAQICQALLYAGSATRKVCHGDLTPSTVIRDSRGMVRVNGFALPSDFYYFTNWSVIGGDNVGLHDHGLPWGQQSDERRAEDTRAVGILLYQLLAGRTPGTTSVEPPADRLLHFMRNIPPELCEIVARVVIRQHPQHIHTLEILHTELKTLRDRFDPPPPAVIGSTSASAQGEDFARIRQFSPAISLGISGNLAASGSGTGYRADAETQMGMSAPSTMADVSLKLAAARQAAYSEVEIQPRRFNLPVLLGVGFLLFILFFVIGYFLAHAIYP